MSLILRRQDGFVLRRPIWSFRLVPFSRELAAAAAADDVMQWIAEGALTPRIDRILPLEQAAEAMRILGRREVLGRIVLETSYGSAEVCTGT